MLSQGDDFDKYLFLDFRICLHGGITSEYLWSPKFLICLGPSSDWAPKGQTPKVTPEISLYVQDKRNRILAKVTEPHERKWIQVMDTESVPQEMPLGNPWLMTPNEGTLRKHGHSMRTMSSFVSQLGTEGAQSV